MEIITLLNSWPAATGLLGLLLGLVVGSFLNVVIIRLPPRLAYQWQPAEAVSDPSQVSAKPPPGIVLGRSHCPKCNHVIRWWENIPVLGFLILRGRCSSCQAQISIRYPTVEAFTAAVTLVVMWRFGVSSVLVPALIFSWTLIALTFIDVDHFLLPDVMTLPLLWLGLLVNLAGGFCDIHSAVIGAVAGYLSLWFVYHLYRFITGRTGFGHGDFKLLATLGAWLGWQMLPLVILLASVVGAAVGISMITAGRLNSRQPLPFGPYLAGAGFIAMLFGQQLVNGYLRFTGLG